MFLFYLLYYLLLLQVTYLYYLMNTNKFVLSAMFSYEISLLCTAAIITLVDDWKKENKKRFGSQSNRNDDAMTVLVRPTLQIFCTLSSGDSNFDRRERWNEWLRETEDCGLEVRVKLRRSYGLGSMLFRTCKCKHLSIA